MRYTNFLQHIQNNYIKGNGNYTRDVMEAYNMLNHYIGAAHRRQQYFNDSEGVDFAKGSKGGGSHNTHARKIC